MTTTHQPLRLTSQIERRRIEGAAHNEAIDGEGRNWYRTTLGPADELMDADGLTDHDVPTWPACAACGQGVDWLNDLHWWHPYINAVSRRVFALR